MIKQTTPPQHHLQLQIALPPTQTNNPKQKGKFNAPSN